jgi:hypothetical protein
MDKQNDPIIIEQAGMRVTVDHRQSSGGDEGLTFDLTVAGAEKIDQQSITDQLTQFELDILAKF